MEDYLYAIHQDVWRSVFEGPHMTGVAQYIKGLRKLLEAKVIHDVALLVVNDTGVGQYVVARCYQLFQKQLVFGKGLPRTYSAFSPLAPMAFDCDCDTRQNFTLPKFARLRTAPGFATVQFRDSQGLGQAASTTVFSIGHLLSETKLRI
ncbi:hypothetical protein LXL04_034433 [Taraxacum kok-saghyz]